jgi:bifunctional non-homologous end joining protein LigD
MSRWPSLDHPDFILIDLDPQECPFDLIVEAALLVKRSCWTDRPGGLSQDHRRRRHARLHPRRAGLQLRGGAHVRRTDRAPGDREKPTCSPRRASVAKRQKNRVYFDYLQIAKSKTIAAPYVLRAYEGAPVATPLEWAR